MTNQLAIKQTTDGAILLEKVMLHSDLSALSPSEKVQHVKNMCDSVGLNPMTHPIKIMKFQGKEIPYFDKGATEQLRLIHKISIKITENKIIDEMYIVVAEASSPDGRCDSSTGAISMQGLKGEAKANAMMKAETKAKRRVTLSICGLGYNDESEMDFARNDQSQKLNKPIPVISKVEIDNSELQELMADFEDFMSAIENSDTELQLRAIFDQIKKIDFKSHPELFKKLINAKDIRKNQILSTIADFNEEIDSVTGEVSHA